MAPGARGAPPPEELATLVAAQCARPTAPILSRLVEALRTRFGDSLAGVLLYGSTLHADDPGDGLVDLYAVVDDYGTAYAERRLRAFNALLPPNVFYTEEPSGHVRVRCKYAVISVPHLNAGTQRWFHPYLWARFAQPARLLYARSREDRALIHDALARAVLKFIEESVPTFGTRELNAEEIWIRGLTLTYAAELRTERDRARKLTDVNLADYDRLTAAAAPALEGSLTALGEGRYRSVATERERRRAVRRWRLRRWQGRLLSILRLSKAVFTFENGADYVAWKIERHTGVRIEVTPGMRRHPILRSPPILWRLLRRGVLR